MDIKDTFFIYSLRKFNNTRANFNSKKLDHNISDINILIVNVTLL